MKNNKDKRQAYVDAILDSPSKKKIVVAGPGTGKTRLFQQLLQGKGRSLVLTFINTLVEDLSLKLGGVSEVRTLHGFAFGIIKQAKKEAEVYPKLSRIIQEDGAILLGQDVDFDRLFHNREDKSEYVEFYRKRKNYYGHYYGFSDIVFAAVKYLEEYPGRIPAYEQVIVDEFQDFNLLEVSLIDLLSQESPILLVGDDDQALYHDLKNASAAHIRHRFCHECQDYTSFDLPYCSRCTRVIVGAANDIINAATHNGLLTDRIDKPFKYFEDAEKNRDSEANPRIVYSHQFAKQIPWFIEKEITKIFEEGTGGFSVLVVSPTKEKAHSITDSLRRKGFRSIECVMGSDDKAPSLLEGLKLIIANKRSNLGWRIAASKILRKADLQFLLRETDKHDARDVVDVIDDDCRRRIRALLKTLRAVKNGSSPDEKDLHALLKEINLDPLQRVVGELKDDIISGFQRPTYPGIRKTPIKVTTIEGSKGLDADYVFITYFDDLFFIKDKDKGISDKDICNFVVILTRAKRKVLLVSSQQSKPTFLTWICEDRIEIH